MPSNNPSLKKVEILIRFIVFFVISIMSGCSVHKNEFRAYIGSNSDWIMEERCGYEGCYPIVDFLKGKNITIRLELGKDYFNKYFTMLAVIMPSSESIQFNVDDIDIEMNNNHFKAKVLNCYSPNRQPNYLWDEHSLSGSVKITEQGCFLLFIDHPTPLTADEVILDFHNAIEVNGNNVNVPLIHFKRNTDPKEK
jgi:hypothetical protein